MLVNNPSGKPIPAERIQSVETLVSSAIGAGESRRVTVVDLPFAEEGAAVGEPAAPWWKQRWMAAVEQNALLALAGLLVLFGGVFPLLRRIAAGHASIKNAAAEAAVAPGDRVRARPEPGLTIPFAAPDLQAIGTDNVRALAAGDPARTAQIIKEWISRDRSSIKHAG